jgi:ATP-dependent phosphoenolpyruvate carboxykinase
MLAERMTKQKANCWLLNTGWTGGKFGVGKRCPLKYTVGFFFARKCFEADDRAIC